MNTSDVAAAKAIVARLRTVQVAEVRRSRREYEPQPLLADLDLFNTDQVEAWSRGDFWAATSGVFVACAGGVRLVSLAEQGRWAA